MGSNSYWSQIWINNFSKTFPNVFLNCGSWCAKNRNSRPRNQIQFQILFVSIVIDLSNSHLRVGMSKPLSGLCPMQWWCQLIRLILFWPRISSCWEAPLILEGAIKECRIFLATFSFFTKYCLKMYYVCIILQKYIFCTFLLSIVLFIYWIVTKN